MEYPPWSYDTLEGDSQLLGNYLKIFYYFPQMQMKLQWLIIGFAINGHEVLVQL